MFQEATRILRVKDMPKGIKSISLFCRWHKTNEKNWDKRGLQKATRRPKQDIQLEKKMGIKGLNNPPN